MKANARRQAALDLLSRTGIWPSNYAPPALHMLWALGLNIPPPHFASFAGSALFTGGVFGVIYGLLMWSVQWSPHGMSVSMAVTLSAVAGILFGLCMASYYAYGRRKHNLPAWDQLEAPRA